MNLLKKWAIPIFVILWIVMIYGFSSQPVTKSRKTSKNVTKVIVQMVKTLSPKGVVNEYKLHNKIRKVAHFFNYFVLGILVSGLLKEIKINNFIKSMIIILFCLLIATGDEFYQSFVPGRGSREKDVLIDVSGGITGIVLIYIFRKIKKVKIK